MRAHTTLLHPQRRLKAEVDRKSAPPALRLLDEMMTILDRDSFLEEDTAHPVAPTAEQRAETRRLAKAHLRAAFGGGRPDVDVVTLAAQLASGGQAVADQLVEEVLDPEAFVADVSALLERATAQQRELEVALEAVPVGSQEHARGSEAAMHRAAAIGQVQEVLEVARAVQQDLIKSQL